MSVQIQRESTEYLYIGVFGNQPAVDQEVAFKGPAERPIEDDWEEAILVDSQHSLWPDAQAATTGDFFVAILIGEFGDDGIELSPGAYQVWVRLTDITERPVRIVPVVLEIE